MVGVLSDPKRGRAHRRFAGPERDPRFDSGLEITIKVWGLSPELGHCRDRPHQMSE
jgi:hypothetical protein